MILALAGGVGGAKLVNGLARILPPSELAIVVNTGDDFDHLGLYIAPDLDSVCYALAGRNDRDRGWGLAGESWNCMEALKALGGQGWFQLGDRDLATHILRTEALKTQSLSEVTQALSTAMGIAHRVTPMSDQPVRSMVDTDEGELSFQHYFVKRQAEPIFRSIRFAEIEHAAPSPGFVQALDHPQLEAILVCPSNPVLSIEPILSLPGVRARIAERRVPLVVVSPFVDGKAIKGPAAKIMKEMGLSADAQSLAAYYDGLLDGIVIHDGDEPPRQTPALKTLKTDIMIPDAVRQEALAREVLDFCSELTRRRPPRE